MAAPGSPARPRSGPKGPLRERAEKGRGEIRAEGQRPAHGQQREQLAEEHKQRVARAVRHAQLRGGHLKLKRVRLADGLAEGEAIKKKENQEEEKRKSPIPNSEGTTGQGGRTRVGLA